MKIIKYNIKYYILYGNNVFSKRLPYIGLLEQGYKIPGAWSAWQLIFYGGSEVFQYSFMNRCKIHDLQFKYRHADQIFSTCQNRKPLFKLLSVHINVWNTSILIGIQCTVGFYKHVLNSDLYMSWSLYRTSNLVEFHHILITT